jgi:hypothetical protein
LLYFNLFAINQFSQNETVKKEQALLKDWLNSFVKKQISSKKIDHEKGKITSLPAKSAGQVCRPSLPAKSAGQVCRPSLPAKSASQVCQPSQKRQS